MNTARNGNKPRGRSGERGFTLLETAIALVIMMIITLGVASLFVYATKANMGADDREIAMAIAQKEWNGCAHSLSRLKLEVLPTPIPDGGLAATSSTGGLETVTSAGRSYVITTIIQDTAFVPGGNPDAGATIAKSIKLSVSPAISNTVFDKVSIYTVRTTQVTGVY
jgi:type II secretory pathway pseudopilin PulG